MLGLTPTAFTGHPVGHLGLCSGRFHGERAPRSSRSLPCLPAPSPQERPTLGELYRARRTPAGHLHLKGTPSREQPTPRSRTNRVVVNLSPPCCDLTTADWQLPADRWKLVPDSKESRDSTGSLGEGRVLASWRLRSMLCQTRIWSPNSDVQS